MNGPTKLSAFAVVITLVFGGAALAGAAIDPTDDTVGADAGDGAEDAHGSGHGGAERTARPASASGASGGDRTGGASAASGLAVSEDGYSLEVERSFFRAGATAHFEFRIIDDRGHVVRDEYELEHEKQLHLIVVRRDTAIFKHLHPRKGENGTWSVDLDLREPGIYRAYADFKIHGKQRTLATDLFVPGEFRPDRLPAPHMTAIARDRFGQPVDELKVELKAPGIRAARETALRFAVSQRGRPFEALEPYLGAKGHLVALREGDLAYLHVHPLDRGSEHAHADDSESTEAHPNEVPFMATFPTVGRYRLFLQFKTGGEVRTVAYTLEVPR